MSYQLNKSHLIISILAAAVITIGFVGHYLMGSPFGYFTMLLWVCAVIIVFYLIGHVARYILVCDVFVPKEETALEEIEGELELEYYDETGVMEPVELAEIEPLDDEFDADDTMFDDSDELELIETEALDAS